MKLRIIYLCGILVAIFIISCGSSGSSGDVKNTPPPTPPENPECDTSFDSTFDAIQEVVFEQQGCTADACHGTAMSGDLDLRRGNSHDDLFDVPSKGSLSNSPAPARRISYPRHTARLRRAQILRLLPTKFLNVTPRGIEPLFPG